MKQERKIQFKTAASIVVFVFWLAGGIASFLALYNQVPPNRFWDFLTWATFAVCVGIVLYSLWMLWSSKVELDKLKLALPKLFQKTEHLREAISVKKLDEYREAIRRHVFEMPGDHPIIEHLKSNSDFRTLFDLISNATSDGQGLPVDLSMTKAATSEAKKNFATNAIRELLADLKDALRAYGGTLDATCSLIMPDSPAEPENRQVSMQTMIATNRTEVRAAKEKEYLKRGLSLASGLLVDKKTPYLSISNMHETIAGQLHFFVNETYPDIEKDMQSVLIVRVIRNGKTVGVLQVDSPKKKAFGHSQVHMVQCTANAIGVVLAIADFINNRVGIALCVELLADQLFQKYQAALQKIATVDKLNQDLVSLKNQLDKRDAELDSAKSETESLKQQLQLKAAATQAAKQELDSAKSETESLKQQLQLEAATAQAAKQELESAHRKLEEQKRDHQSAMSELEGKISPNTVTPPTTRRKSKNS